MAQFDALISRCLKNKKNSSFSNDINREKKLLLKNYFQVIDGLHTLNH